MLQLIFFNVKTLYKIYSFPEILHCENLRLLIAFSPLQSKFIKINVMRVSRRKRKNNKERENKRIKGKRVKK